LGPGAGYCRRLGHRQRLEQHLVEQRKIAAPGADAEASDVATIVTKGLEQRPSANFRLGIMVNG
jgi:hypothetical protein